MNESFAQEVLNKIAAIEEKIAYETKEAEDIINERSTIKKEASDNGLSGTQTMPVQDSIVLQKHLLPEEAADLEVGGIVFADGNYYKLVDKEGAQNDKNEDSSSLWKFVRCEAPKDSKEPEVRIKL